MTPEGKELLLKIKDLILEKPDTINMYHWHQRGNYIPDDAQDCGTVHCIAGYAQVLTKRFGEDPEFVGKTALGLTNDEAVRLFLLREWPGHFQCDYEKYFASTPESAKVVADRIDHFIATNGQE